MHKNEKDWLENGNPPLPPGVTLWGKVFASLMGALFSLIHVVAFPFLVPNKSRNFRRI